MRSDPPVVRRWPLVSVDRAINGIIVHRPKPVQRHGFASVGFTRNARQGVMAEAAPVVESSGVSPDSVTRGIRLDDQEASVRYSPATRLVHGEQGQLCTVREHFVSERC